MSAAKHDLIVIGSGPAGEKGAAQAAYFGKRVALIEQAPTLGGAVANTSIPFKALRETALYLAGFRSRKLRGVNVQMKERATLRDFLSQEHGLVRDYRLKVVTNLDNHNVDVVPGRASFVDPHTVKVEHPRRPPLLLSADVILIACGSRPHRPPQFDFDGGGIYNSNTFIRADCMPESLVVVGAGPIGCEYACIMALLGCSVTLIDAAATFLPFLDSEVASLLQESLMETGIDLIASSQVDRVSAGPPFTLTLDSGRELKADAIVVAAGRIGNTDGLALENAGLTRRRARFSCRQRDLSDRAAAHPRRRRRDRLPRARLQLDGAGPPGDGPCVRSEIQATGAEPAALRHLHHSRMRDGRGDRRFGATAGHALRRRAGPLPQQCPRRRHR